MVCSGGAALVQAVSAIMCGGLGLVWQLQLDGSLGIFTRPLMLVLWIS